MKRIGPWESLDFEFGPPAGIEKVQFVKEFLEVGPIPGREQRTPPSVCQGSKGIRVIPVGDELNQGLV